MTSEGVQHDLPAAMTQGFSYTQKYGSESCEAINWFASFTDADTLTDRQLKLSDRGMHSMHASSFSQSSVKDLEAPGPIKLAIELMKLFNSRSGSDVRFRSSAAAFSIDSWLGIDRNSGMALLDSGDRESNTGASIRTSNRHSECAPSIPQRALAAFVLYAVWP
jgi:hypothetical protein